MQTTLFTTHHFKKSLLASFIMGATILPTGCGGGSSATAPVSGQTVGTTDTPQPTNTSNSGSLSYEFLEVTATSTAKTSAVYRQNLVTQTGPEKMLSNVTLTDSLPVLAGAGKQSLRYSLAFTDSGIYTLDRNTGHVDKVMSDTQLAQRCEHNVLPGQSPALSLNFAGPDAKCHTADDTYRLSRPLAKSSQALTGMVDTALNDASGEFVLWVGRDAAGHALVFNSAGNVVFTSNNKATFTDVHWIDPAKMTVQDEVLVQVDKAFYRISAEQLRQTGLPSEPTFTLPDSYYNAGFMGYGANGEIYIESQQDVHRYSVLNNKLTTLTDKSAYLTIAPGTRLTTGVNKHSVGITGNTLFIAYELNDYSGTTKYVVDRINLSSGSITRGQPGVTGVYFLPYGNLGAMAVQYEDYKADGQAPRAELYSPQGSLVASFDNARMSAAYQTESATLLPTLAIGEGYNARWRTLTDVELHLLNPQNGAKEKLLFRKSGDYRLLMPPLMMRTDRFLAKEFVSGTAYYQLFLNEPAYKHKLFTGLSGYALSIIY